MGKRKNSFADSDAKRPKNPFILDDVEEVDDDYDSEGEESVADSVEAPAKRIKKANGGKRKSEKVSKELAAAIKETERRAIERQRQRNLFA